MHWALVCYAGLAFVLAVYLGPTYAMIQSLVAPSMRATAIAIMLFIVNLIGLGLGPLTVGMVSDHLTPAMGDGAALRIGLVVAAIMMLVGAALYVAAGVAYRRHLTAEGST
jgi:MFS family permease